MMKKDIVRPGDIVKIINPEFFIRCGYPLSLKDGVKMILDDEKGIQALENAIKEILKDKNGLDNKIIPINGNSFQSILRSHDFYNIVRILAYYKILKEKFGGNERKIYTKKVKEAKGHEFTVLSKKMVVTGKYIPGSRLRRWEDDDYDPPYLDDTKSHMILYLSDGSIDGDFFYVSNIVRPLANENWKLLETNDIFPLAIERCNVEKVIKE